MRIYLAGPLGFSEAGKAFHDNVVVKLLSDLGHDLLDPWKLAPASKISAVLELPYGEQKRDIWSRINLEIGENNRLAIQSCDIVFAVLDGPDVDSGTASEIGYAFALGKPILGYRGDFRLSADNEGSIVNLQVEYFIKNGGGEIITKIADLPAALQRAGALGARPHEAGVQPPRATSTPLSISKQQITEQAAWRLIISILLALIVRAALEAVFKGPVQAHEAWPAPIVWGQFITFSVMMARFYLGATRYLDTQPHGLPFPIQVVNVVFASLLFCAFYVVGLAVAEIEFYFALVGLHVVDALWFIIAFAYSFYVNPPDVPGEIRIAAHRKIMGIFFGLSVATIAWAWVLYLLLDKYIEPSTAMWLFLVGLWLLSISDFRILFDYYFRHTDWIARNKA
jgi:nucleoside 2-deoxyribosyltransferase